MYCGDETGAYIGDIGSHSCRFGYGGEDSPKWVVPSYVARYDGNDNHQSNNPNNSNSTMLSASNYYIPTSCYSSRLADHRLESILRMAAEGDSTTTATTTSDVSTTETILNHQQQQHNNPLVDPNAFLQQGDVVQNWDAFEAAWQTSFDVLHVRDKYKHTTGGGNSAFTDVVGGGGGVTTDVNTTTTTTELATTTTPISTAPTSTTIRPAATQNTGSDERCVHPLLCVTPGATHICCGTKYNAAVHREQLARTTEILLEQLDATALFCAPTPMLCSFSLGRQTALVVDVGAGGCRVTPIVDGLVVKQAQRRNGRGGDYLGHVQWKALLVAKQQQQQVSSSSAATILPRCLLRKKPPNPSTISSLLYQWGIQDVMYEFRTSSHVSLAPWQYDETPLFQDMMTTTTSTRSHAPSSPMDVDETGTTTSQSPSAEGAGSATGSANSSTMPTLSTAPPDSMYALPDGTIIDLTSPMGKDLCRIPELLFTDTCPFVPSTTNSTTTASVLAEHDSLSNLPLHKLIHASLLAVPDVDLRKELCHNILLVGAGSLIPNLEQRLSVDVKRVVPSMIKCRVVASRTQAERSCAAWIGASVLTSLGSFQQLWLSRTEYEEYGVHLSIQRFP